MKGSRCEWCAFDLVVSEVYIVHRHMQPQVGARAYPSSTRPWYTTILHQIKICGACLPCLAVMLFAVSTIMMSIVLPGRVDHKHRKPHERNGAHLDVHNTTTLRFQRHNAVHECNINLHHKHTRPYSKRNQYTGWNTRRYSLFQ